MAAAAQAQSAETTTSFLPVANSGRDRDRGDEMLARRTSPTRRTPLRLVPCQRCGAANFVSGDLPLLSPITCGRCQRSMLIPMRLRQYELRKVLGVGGMGTVYQATDFLLQRDVAAKLIRPELAENRRMLEAFLREARYAASLSHTNIIAIHSLEESEGHSLLTMELAAGGSLGHRLADQGRLPELQVLDLGIKIASALAAALDKRLLHRDVKPGNILFDAAGEPKLADFGLARTLEDGDADAEHAPWATPHYTAPERVLGQTESFASDLYSLAATLYHAATGAEPFNAPTIKEVFAAHSQDSAKRIMNILELDPYPGS